MISLFTNNPLFHLDEKSMFTTSNAYIHSEKIPKVNKKEWNICFTAEGGREGAKTSSYLRGKTEFWPGSASLLCRTGRIK